MHAWVADLRGDLLHKVSAQLVKGAGLFAIEDLNVAGMMKNRRLAKAIGGASFGELRQQIHYMADWYGREVVVIDHWAPSSKACSGCRYVLPDLPLSIRSWTCSVCGGRPRPQCESVQEPPGLGERRGVGSPKSACGAVKTPEALAA